MPRHPCPQARLKETLAYGQPSQFDNTVRRATSSGTPITDSALTTPLQDLDGIITPSGLHFLMDHVNGIPDIDPQQHRLLMHGMVDRPLSFTMDELRRFPSVSKVYFLECNANSRPLRGPNGDSVQLVHGRTSCSEWTGVLLSVLLKECGVKAGASWVVAEGSESNKYTMSIPLAKCMDDTLVAYAQNGEPVRPHNGYPLRLVVPGWEAIRAVKWLSRIAVVDRPAMAWHEAGNNADTNADGKALGFPICAGPEIGDHSPVRGPAPSRPRLLRDHGAGVDRWRLRAESRRVDRRWPDLQGSAASAAGASVRAHTVSLRVGVERRRGRAAVALHR